MRILKYLFQLLLLVFVALSVYFFTQEGQYSVHEKVTIELPKPALFNYVNNYRNWDEFLEVVVKDSTAIVNFSKVSEGIAASVKWKNTAGEGSFKTIFAAKNDSIVQEAAWQGNSLHSCWLFKETENGTEVTWNVSGDLDFKAKIYRFF